jgi:hypothetical protein
MLYFSLRAGGLRNGFLHTAKLLDDRVLLLDDDGCGLWLAA